MKSGTKPTPIDHRDFGHFQTFGAVIPPTFPPSYTTDAQLWQPNQEIQNITPTFTTPPLEFGCTDFSTADSGSDLVGILLNPYNVDKITNANASGGAQVRTALTAGVTIGYFKAYFNVQPVNLDFFDSVRLASISGVPEKRSVVIGSKWFSNPFETVDSTGILSIPNFSDPNFTWHCWKIAGWKTINDQVYLIGKSWQGSEYGDGGYCYFSRPLFNQLMSIGGSVAFSVTNATPPPPQTINTSIVEWIISNFRLLLGLQY